MLVNLVIYFTQKILTVLDTRVVYISIVYLIVVFVWLIS